MPQLPRLMGCNVKLEQVVSVAGSQGAVASHAAPSSRSTWNDHGLETLPLFQEQLVWERGDKSSSVLGQNLSARFAAPPGVTWQERIESLGF